MPLNKQIDSHHWVDGMNELQIRERAHLPNDEIVAQLAAVGPKAVEGRWGTPPPMRYLPIPFGPPIGWTSLKYLLDVGFTRDVWAHRIDICAATGRAMELTPDHDGRLVADIVGEWATIHDQPFELVLEGPAGRQVQPRHRRRARRDRRHRLRPRPLRSPARHRRSRPPAPALKTARSEDSPLRQKVGPDGNHRRRDRRRHLPLLHPRARHRPDRLQLQPVPGRRRRAAPVPHRSARHVPPRCRRRSPR